MSTPPVLTLEEVAEVCGVSLGSVRRWLAEHNLPAATVGLKRRLVFPAKLKAWAAEQGIDLLADPATVAQPWPRRPAA